MKHEFRSELDDGEGQGDMKRRQALIDKEKRKEVRIMRVVQNILSNKISVVIIGTKTLEAEEAIAGENEE